MCVCEHLYIFVCIGYEIRKGIMRRKEDILRELGNSLIEYSDSGSEIRSDRKGSNWKGRGSMSEGSGE